MHFASSLPWWLALLLAAGVAGVAFLAYRRSLVPLSPAQRNSLIALRTLSLLAVALFLLRPIVLLPPEVSGDAVIPLLVDVSRSMRVRDEEGDTRLARATALVRSDLLSVLSQHGHVDLLGVGDGVSPATLEALGADARKTDLNGALAAVRDRYRGRRVSGIVVLSDGGDTGQSTHGPSAGRGPPVFAIGIGSVDGLPDREVTGLAAGDPRLDQAAVDLHVSAVSHGFGREPFQLRILANGQVIDNRRVTPMADGTPIEETFTVAPNPLIANVYTAEIAPEPGEAVPENNLRSIVVNPAGRKRLVLVLSGAPGYEYSFLARALTQDPGLEVDSVVRKGKNDESVDTFLVQAGGGRASALTSGFPATREALFTYDAVVIANIEGYFFTRAQLEMAADFVGERGGGLLVLGGRSFEQRGLSGTALESVLPLESNDRRGGAVRPNGNEDARTHDKIALTPEGELHPVMRIGTTREESRKLWASLPPLAASASVGGPRPGASVLAVTTAASGATLPVVAVQRYGRGRSMVFAGEASWRWRMMQPATDRRYQFFWRQALRWLSADAPDPVSVTVSAEPEPGETVVVEADARDRAFLPLQGANVEGTLTVPGGQTKPVALRQGGGRYVGAVVPEAVGLYRVQVEARLEGVSVGSADRWFYVGGRDRELAEPRLNEGFLKRLAKDSGGKYVRAIEASSIAADIRSAVPPDSEPVRRDLWHEPWAFALIVGLLAAEWILRRTWGLR